MYVSAIVVAAGQGKRFRAKISKPILDLKRKPVISYPLKVLDKHPDIKEIIIVGNAKNFRELVSVVRRYKIKKAAKVILGGKERQDSVLRGLKATADKADFVLIHDGVRPFINKDLVSTLIKQAYIYKAAIAGVAVKPTIKIVDKGGFVTKTINRRHLWEIQTPQVYSKELLLRAYKKFGNHPVTDEAALIEKSGLKVKIVTGSYYNVKITTPEDLIIAKGIAQIWKTA
jgi:2-C-methyl-D-erythritol 4-phosphate cytidylyltransferase